MTTQTTTWMYTPEQKVLWDKSLSTSGYYQVTGEQAFTFMSHNVRRIVANYVNPKTVLLVGSTTRCERLLKYMVDEEVIDDVLCHQPRFFRFDDRYDLDARKYIARTPESEMDAECFRNFIATSVDKQYFPIGAVVIFDGGFTNGKPYQHLDKVLEVPIWKNGHVVKTIKPLVFNVCDGDCGDDALNFKKESSEAASIDWRKDVKTYFELSQEKPVMLIEHLLPEKALTIMAAPSYTGKTHFAIEMGLALATESNFLDHFKGPAKPVPVSYHVPELHESLFHDFTDRLNGAARLKDCPDNFLIRTLEHDLWQLDSAQMIDSSRGRYVFLDTVGYFNDADDSASYTQAIEFAKKINNLIREGCLGVCALYHPPKYAKNKKDTGNIMTLENQILGSAGYGGVLRSCLGLRNLHEDSNKGLWVYVQGLKNPGLQGPFQVEGVPLKLVKKPGESLYLSELLRDGGSKREQICGMLADGKGVREICAALKVSSKTVSKVKQEELEFDSDEGEQK
jgi:AAA domain-containing protein